MKKVLLIMILVVAALAGLVLWSARGVWEVVDSGLESESASETVSAIDVPSVNPAENTNPIRDSYTNPFE
jgi:hypothetical protein